MTVQIREDRNKIAFCEVLYIINNMSYENRAKIPNTFIDMLDKNKSDEYIVNLPTDALNHPELMMSETKNILAIMYRDYFCDENQKKELLEIWKENYKKEEEDKIKKYNPDTIFKKDDVEHEEKSNNTDLIEYKESNKWFYKIIDFIKKFFKAR